MLPGGLEVTSGFERGRGQAQGLTLPRPQRSQDFLVGPIRAAVSAWLNLAYDRRAIATKADGVRGYYAGKRIYGRIHQIATLPLRRPTPCRRSTPLMVRFCCAQDRIAVHTIPRRNCFQQIGQ